MKGLQRVTITGADDRVATVELFGLSKEFPFVEWGILFSPKRQGREPRYPSKEWIVAAVEAEHANPAVWPRFAAHLCGKAAHDVFQADAYWWFDRWQAHFDRVQLNGFSDYVSSATQAAIRKQAEYRRSLEFILQVPHLGALIEAEDIARLSRRMRPPSFDQRDGNITALFDASGGRGTRPASWPAPPYEIRIGYAGGLGPDNVEAELSRLETLAGDAPFWIDMESGIRTDDRFDLTKVRRVLEIAARQVAEEGKVAANG